MKKIFFFIFVLSFSVHIGDSYAKEKEEIRYLYLSVIGLDSKEEEKYRLDTLKSLMGELTKLNNAHLVLLKRGDKVNSEIAKLGTYQVEVTYSESENKYSIDMKLFDEYHKRQIRRVSREGISPFQLITSTTTAIRALLTKI